MFMHAVQVPRQFEAYSRELGVVVSLGPRLFVADRSVVFR